MISVICCFNDYSIYHDVLLASLSLQSFKDYEIIAIDNRNNKYMSAAKAYNGALALAKYNKVLFVHQDFAFRDKQQLERIDSYLDKVEPYSVIGAAGALLDDKASLLDKIMGKNRKIVSNINHYRGVNELTEVSSLDECCFSFMKEDFDDVGFDEATCDAWDLYCVDLCLCAQERQGKCYVLKMNAEHLSYGCITINFYLTLYRVLKKHSNFRTVTTTCVVAHTRYAAADIIRLIIIHICKTIIKRINKQI
jgi:hypothetical protein